MLKQQDQTLIKPTKELELSTQAQQLFQFYEEHPSAPKTDFAQNIGVGEGFTIAESGSIVAHCANLDTCEDDEEIVISFCVHDDSKGKSGFDIFSGQAASAPEFWQVYSRCRIAFVQAVEAARQTGTQL